jgi:hypothetical protein
MNALCLATWFGQMPRIQIVWKCKAAKYVACACLLACLLSRDNLKKILTIVLLLIFIISECRISWILGPFQKVWWDATIYYIANTCYILVDIWFKCCMSCNICGCIDQISKFSLWCSASDGSIFIAMQYLSFAWIVIYVNCKICTVWWS